MLYSESLYPRFGYHFIRSESTLAPSSNLMFVSFQLVFIGCLTCGFLLYFAPEEPSPDLNGGHYTFIPTIALLVAGALTMVTLLLGWCGTFKDSKIVLIVVSSFLLFTVPGVHMYANYYAVFSHHFFCDYSTTRKCIISVCIHYEWTGKINNIIM